MDGGSRFSEFYLQSLIHYKAVKLKNIKKHTIKFVLIFFMFCSEMTIKDKVLKIFTELSNQCESNKTQNNEIRPPVSEIYLTK